MGSQYLAKASHRESGVLVRIPVFVLTTAHEEIHGLFYIQKNAPILYMHSVASYVLSTEFL